MKNMNDAVRYLRCAVCMTGIGLVSVLVFAGCAASSAGKPETVPAPSSSRSSSAGTIPDFSVPVPTDPAHRTYLGIEADASDLSLSRIPTPLVLIEIFNMYCPHCQKEAPRVNELFARIASSPELSASVTIIGIGIGNTPFEVDVFRKKYAVPFPLFADEQSTISRDLGARATPTFIGVRRSPQGPHAMFYNKSGSFGDIDEMLALLQQEAGRKE